MAEELYFGGGNDIISLFILLLFERGELMRADKKGQNEVWLHAKPVNSDVCME